MKYVFSNNPYLQALAEKVIRQKTDSDMAEWVCNNTTLAGGPFSLKNRGYQRAVLADMHPNLCCKKLSQIGMTECQIRKALGFMVMNPGTRVLYTFPTKILKDNNSAPRIRPIFDTDFPGQGDIRNNNILQIGSSFLYISGGSESDVTSTPVDMILNDEIDLGTSEFYALANSRLQASVYQIKQSFSTPTFENFGISADYNSSDQREYFVKCPHCNEWQVPLYDLESVYIPKLPKFIQRLTDIKEDVAVGLDYDNSCVVCKKCRHPLDLSDDAIREWVPTYPSREHHRGYQIRPFSTNLLSIKYLVMTMADCIKRGQIRRGYNTVLGEEYKEGDARIDVKAIKKCFKSQVVPEVSPDKPVYIGIDEGLTCHIVLYTDGAAFAFIRVIYDQLLSKVKELDKKYNIVAGAIDRYPYTPLSNDIRDMTEGRIQPVVYGGQKIAEPKHEQDKAISFYMCNRTHALDAVKSKIVNGEVDFYGYYDQEELITEHLQDMAREDVPGKQPEWVKLNGNDHYFHAFGYALLAKQIKYVVGLGLKNEDRTIISLTGPEENYKNKDKMKDRSNLCGYMSGYSTNRLLY